MTIDEAARRVRLHRDQARALEIARGIRDSAEFQGMTEAYLAIAAGDGTAETLMANLLLFALTCIDIGIVYSQGEEKVTQKATVQ
jgi:hypothetical protein